MNQILGVVSNQMYYWIGLNTKYVFAVRKSRPVL